MAKKKKSGKDKSVHYTHLEVAEADVVIESGRVIKNRPGNKAPIPDGCYVRLMPGSLVPGHPHVPSTSLRPPFYNAAQDLPMTNGTAKNAKRRKVIKTYAEGWRTIMATIAASASSATLIYTVTHLG